MRVFSPGTIIKPSCLTGLYVFFSNPLEHILFSLCLQGCHFFKTKAVLQKYVDIYNCVFTYVCKAEKDREGYYDAKQQ